MALREARRQARPVTACNGDAILKSLQGADLKGLTTSLKTCVAPIVGNSGPGKENAAKTELHNLAKEFVPFLVQFLKTCGACLASTRSLNDTAAQGRADELFSSMAIALDSLNQLRSYLSGCSFEIEIQRYGLVRRFMAWKRYSAGLAQSEILFRSLCQLNSSSNSKTAKKQATAGRIARGGAGKINGVPDRLAPVDCEILSPPQKVEETVGLPALVVAAVIDLIWCTVEGSGKSPTSFRRVAQLPEQLDPWISVLDAGSASKQRDALFRALYKCTLVMVAEPSKFETGLIQQLCKLTLNYCTLSTQRDQYAKVARKICSSLGLLGADWTRIAVDLCSTAFSEISKLEELQSIQRNNDLLELVDWFARSCQTTRQLEQGWLQIYKLVDQTGQVCTYAPIAIAGLYGVGLLLMELETNKCGDSGQDVHLSCLESKSTIATLVIEASHLLHRAEEFLKCVVEQNSPTSYKGIPTTESLVFQEQAMSRKNPGGKVIAEIVGRTYVNIARALHYVQKPFCRHVQIAWNEHISRSCEKRNSHYSDLDYELGKVLQLSYPVIERGMRCSDLDEIDKEVIKKGFQIASQLSIGALRLSLLQGSDIQVAALCVANVMKYLQPEEQWWLMSSTYNMGVQLFNVKDYASAYWPLELAYKAAWTRIKLSSHDTKTGLSLVEIVSEACAKCGVLADARNRNGQPGESRLILIDGLTQWAKIQSVNHNLKLPHALVKSFVKLTCTESKEVLCKKDKEPSMLFSLLSAVQPPLPMEIVGLLLEEELSAYTVMEHQCPEISYALKEQILRCLLGEIYVGKKFTVERARLLIEKSRVARSCSFVDDLPSCIKHISEALSSLELAWETSKKSSGCLEEVLSLEQLMATAYSMRALCSYELDPHHEDFISNVVLCLKMWRYTLESSKLHGGLLESKSSQVTDVHEEEPLVLLLSIGDLLSIQGYSALLSEVQEVILEFIAYTKPSSTEDEWLGFWMNGQMSHALCPVLFPPLFLSKIRQTFNPTAQALEYWRNCVNRYPGSVLEAHHLAVQESHGHLLGMEMGASTKVEDFKVVQNIKDMLREHVSNGSKTANSVLQSARFHQLISELALWRGDMREAINFAKDALNLRIRLFKRIFRGFERTLEASNDASPPSNGTGKVIMRRDPLIVKTRHYLSNPSEWRILGDYIESLMQVGVIYERMGVVDEAERSFREGYRLASAQNLPYALAAFSSCLGEVHRKKHLWGSAEVYFEKAKQSIECFRAYSCCKSCILRSKALLEVRIGDLVRHNWLYQEGKRLEQTTNPSGLKLLSADGLTDALSHYLDARASLSLLSQGSNSQRCSEKKALNNFCKTQKAVLSTLRQQGKQVSSEILSETDCRSVSKPRKPRLRRSVHTRSSILSQSEENDVEAMDLRGLCEDLRLTSLSSNTARTLHLQSRASLTGVKENSKDSIGRSCKLEVQHTDGVSAKEVNFTRQQRVTDRGERVSSVETEANADIKRFTELHGEYSSNHQRKSCLQPISVEDWPAHVWDQHSRKVFARVLLQQGKCHIHFGQLDEAEQMLKEAVSVLSSCCSCHFQRNDPGVSFFPVQEGVLLYHVSRLLLQRGQQHAESLRPGKRSTRLCIDSLEKIKVQSINKLYRAFSLCHQVPPLLRKIAKLLAILYVPSPPRLSPVISGTSVSMEAADVAAYFHQISLGTTLREQHLAILDSKLNGSSLQGNQPSPSSSARKCMESMQQALRIVPGNVENIGNQATEFLGNLPCPSVCCLSFVDKEDVGLLRGICLPWVEDSPAMDWLLMTRINAHSKSIVFLVPIVPILASRPDKPESSPNHYSLSDDEVDSSTEEDISQTELLNPCLAGKKTVLQRVAEEFGSILEESRLSTSGDHPVATTEEKSTWWKWRMQLDGRLLRFLRVIEDSWLGHLKCLLLGEPVESAVKRFFELSTDHLLEMLSSMTSSKRNGKKVLDRSFVKVLLQGVDSLTTCQLERAIAGIIGWNDYCYCEMHVGESGVDCTACKWKTVEVGRYDQLQKAAELFRAVFMVSMQASETDPTKAVWEEVVGMRRSKRQPKGKAIKQEENFLDIIFATYREKLDGLAARSKRQPMQLILDGDSQAIPWESLPFLRNCEIYRMPSLGSIHAVYIQHQFDGTADPSEAHEAQRSGKRSVVKEELHVPDGGSVPCAHPSLDVTFVNPSNAYFILNPSGDLRSTQAAFEDWFVQQPGWNGKAGTAPTVEEFKIGLQDHDLFVYLGHGSGDQFLPERYVRQLNHCAATLLMGCSSGRLSLRGEYEPFGVVHSYLMAGCPAIIANLWDVTDGDIDRFSRFLLQSWMTTDSGSINGRSRGRSWEGDPDRMRMGVAIGQSRNACKLPHLIGASPVYYGVPTGIRKQVANSSS